MFPKYISKMKNSDNTSLINSKKRIMKSFIYKKFNKKRPNNFKKKIVLVMCGKKKICPIILLIIICLLIGFSIIKLDFKRYIKTYVKNRTFEQNNISPSNIKFMVNEREKENIKSNLINEESKPNLAFNLNNQIDEEFLSHLENHLKTEKIYNYNDFPLPPTPRTNNMHGPFSEEDKEKLREVVKFTKINRELILLAPIPKDIISNPKLSIFVSAFNTDNFLPYFIRSFQNQNLTEWELLIANDGSTDNSLKLLNIFAKYDQRIKVINFEKNKGIAYAWSLEVEKALGEYLLSVDSDDYEANYDSLYWLYKTAKETGAEYIKSGMAWAWDGTFYQHTTHFTDMPNKLIPIKDFPVDVIRRQYHNFEFAGLHNDVFHAPLIKKVFEEIKDIFKYSKIKLSGFTDTIISTAIALKANTIYFLPKLTYFYDNRPKKNSKRLTFENKNLQMDEMAHLAYLRICLRFTNSDDTLLALMDWFKKEYEKNDFTKINKIFKEDFIIFCGELEERLKEAKFFENNNATYKNNINLIKDKCNLMRNSDVTIFINE